MQSQDKRPISPQQLFQRLLSGNFKQVQCIDEAAHVKQQRQVLISLISEYRQQISKQMVQFDRLEHLSRVRNQLRFQLEKLREERVSIDRNMSFQIEKHKLSPVQIDSHGQRRAQIQQMRVKNTNLQLRLKQLTQYAIRIEKHNFMLEKENKIIRQTDFRLRTTSDISYGCSGGIANERLAQRMRIIRAHQQTLSRDISNKMRERQKQSVLQAKLQQEQIEARNRRRMQSFQQKIRRI